MRRIVTVISVAGILLSAPAFAQNVSNGAAPVQQPSGASVVNYQNGLNALGQGRPEDRGNGQELCEGPSGTVACVAVLGAGAAGLAWAIIQANKHNSVSP